MITSEELMEKLISEIEMLGIDVEFGNLIGAGAYVSYKYRAAIIDPKKSTPFGVCHEYFHAKYKDILRCSEYDWDNPREKRADKEATLYLWKYFEGEGGTIDNLTHFLNITGCPRDFAKLIIRNELEEECTRNDVEEKVTNYLNNTDEEPENWNSYRIMDMLRINRQWEFLVVALIVEYINNMLN